MVSSTIIGGSAPGSSAPAESAPGAAGEAAGSGERHCRPIDQVVATPIDDLGGDSVTTPMDLNDRGEVVGVSDTPVDEGHAFLWRRGVTTDLTPWVRGYSIAVANNDRGQVLLRWTETEIPREGVILWSPGGDEVHIASNHPQDLNDRGQVLFDANSLWDDGTITFIGPPEPGLDAVSTHLGEGGHVVGTLWPIPEPGGGHPPAVGAFIWEDGTTTEMDIEPYSIGEAVDVDRRGRALLNVHRTGGVDRALLWHDGEYVDLGSLGGPDGSTLAYDMNERGQVVGWSTTTSGDRHAFLWEDGEMTDLDGLPGRQSQATSIGDRGHVVGSFEGGLPGLSEGFLWWCGEMADLGENEPGNGPVNARGQVVGSGGPDVGLALLTPVRRR